MRRLVPFMALVCACAAKKQREPEFARPPVSLVSARSLIAAPGGKHLAFLVDSKPAPEPSVPEDIFVGSLALAEARPEAGHRVVGAGVSTVQGGFAFAPGGSALIFLAGYSHTQGSGELTVVPTFGAPAVKIAPAVTFWSTSPDGRLLAYVAQGKLGIRPLDSGSEATYGENVGSFEFAPNSATLLYRVRAASGGALHRVHLEKRTDVELARNVSQYGFAGSPCPMWIARSPIGEDQLWAGEGCPRPGQLAVSAQSFTVSPQGDRVAFLTTPQDPGSPYGDLLVLDLAGKVREPVLAGKRVSEYRFAPAGGALAWLESVDPVSRNGKLGLGLPGEASRVQAKAAQAFSFDPSGRWLAYLHRNPKKMFTIELHLVALASGAEARRIDEGVYGYQFSRDGQRLAYKARCQDEARSCTVFVVDTEDSAEPVEVATKIAGVEFLPDGKRLLLLPQHKGSGKAVDLMVTQLGGAAPVLLDTALNPGARVLGEEASSVAYIVIEKGREGVYVAPL